MPPVATKLASWQLLVFTAWQALNDVQARAHGTDHISVISYGSLWLHQTRQEMHWNTCPPDITLLQTESSHRTKVVVTCSIRGGHYDNLQCAMTTEFASFTHILRGQFTDIMANPSTSRCMGITPERFEYKHPLPNHLGTQRHMLCFLMPCHLLFVSHFQQ